MLYFSEDMYVKLGYVGEIQLYCSIVHSSRGHMQEKYAISEHTFSKNMKIISNSKMSVYEQCICS